MQNPDCRYRVPRGKSSYISLPGKSDSCAFPEPNHIWYPGKRWGVVSSCLELSPSSSYASENSTGGSAHWQQQRRLPTATCGLQAFLLLVLNFHLPCLISTATLEIQKFSCREAGSSSLWSELKSLVSVGRERQCSITQNTIQRPRINPIIVERRNNSIWCSPCCSSG